MKKAWKRLKEKFEEDPEKVMLASAACVAASAALINALTNAKRSRTHDREVHRRIRKDRRRGY